MLGNGLIICFETLVLSDSLMVVEFTSNAALQRVFWLYKHCWTDDRNMLNLNLKIRYK